MRKLVNLLALCPIFYFGQIKEMVTGGFPTSINDNPHQVALYKNGEFSCGGSILNEEWILTAAHCVDESAHYKIKLGTTTLSQNGLTYDIVQKIIHPNYSLDNDIALVKVKGRIPYGTNVQPVRLVEKNENLYDIGRIASVSGWGQLYPDTKGSSNHLQKVEVPIISNAEASRQLDITSPGHPRLTPNMMATGAVSHNRKGACHGDSGGALVTKDHNGNIKQIGIVSWGVSKCTGNENSPSIYTKVANYIDWINQYVTAPIYVQGNSSICHTTETYIAENPNNTPIHWQLSNDIEEVSRTENSITIKPKANFNGLATIKVSDGETETTKKIWVGKPNVEYQLALNNTSVNYNLISKDANVSLEEQGITDIVCRDSNNEFFRESRECKSGNFYSYDTKWWAQRETKVSNACGIQSFTQLIRAPYISTNPCDGYRISYLNADRYRLSSIPCVDIPDDRLHPYSARQNTLNVSSKGENTTITIQISDIRGRILITTQHQEFSLEHLLPGTYYARVIKNGQIIHTQTLLKN